MAADPEEILRGIRHLRKRAARGDLAWIRERYDAGKLRFLRKLLPDGGYARLGHELQADDVLGVRASLASIDDDLIALQYTADDPVPSSASARAAEFDDAAERPRLITIGADDDYASAATSVFAPIDDPRREYESYADDPLQFDEYGDERDDFFAGDDDDLQVIDDDYDYAGPQRTQRVVEPVSRARATRGAAPARGGAGRVAAAGARTAAGRPKPKLQWLYIGLAGLVALVFAITRCGGGDGDDNARVNTTAPTTAAGANAGTSLPAVQQPAQPTIQGSIPVNPAPTAGQPAPGAPTTAPVITVPPPGAPFTILFASGSAAVDATGQTIASQAAERIRQQKPTRVLVYGYASPEGNPTANNELSLRRAKAVETLIKNALGNPATPVFVTDAKTDDKPDPDPAKVRRVTITLVT